MKERSRRRLVPPGLVVMAFLLLPLTASAQLNEHCVVSVLNRTAEVGADGSWVLPNVPANIGRVRARATCVQDGMTRSGQSDYFIIPRNGVVDVPDITFVTVAPVPAKLELLSPQTTFGQVGQTVQVVARATYPNGSVAT